LIHTLNQRYRAQWARAEALRTELDHIRGSRLWPVFTLLRRVRSWFGGARRRSADACGGCTSGLRLDAHQGQAPAGRVSIIIPFTDQLGLLRHCLHSLRRSSYRDFEIVLVDNGSQQTRTLRYLDHLRQRRRIRIVRDGEPFNFARLCNRGARAARGDWLLFLNNDVEILTPDWLERMLEIAAHPRVGVVGATLLHPDGSLQHAGIFPLGEGRWQHLYQDQPAGAAGAHAELHHVRAVPAVTGACLLIAGELFAELGGFDERFAADYNDVDLCRRAHERGLLTAITPHARLIHFGSLSRGFTAASGPSLLVK
jgi:GT2 family glycosyltransferase